MDLKDLISYIAIALVVIGYAPYIIDTIKGKTRPHVFTYFVWLLATFIIFLLQISSGGGTGAWITLTVTLLMAIVFLLSLKNGKSDIKKVDIIFLLLAILAIPLWIIAEQPVLSIIILCTIDILGFVPTIRKSWNEPWSETLSLYVITFFRHGLAIIALAEINFVTALFPVSWTLANAFFALMLLQRRKVIVQPTAK